MAQGTLLKRSSSAIGTDQCCHADVTPGTRVSRDETKLRTDCDTQLVSVESGTQAYLTQLRNKYKLYI